ncbi:MAG: 50S ribosomal protein L6 [Vampirovibrionales bacterium]
MSRIGKAPIDVPNNVEVSIDTATNVVVVKGSLGTLTREFRREISIEREGQTLRVVPTGETRTHRALHGLSRTLLNNMVQGVATGFTKNLELVGVGYRASVQGNTLSLALGFSHPVEFQIPAGLEVKVEANTKIAIKGYDKQAVGDLAAAIRAKRPPEPYKAKGVRYAGEVIRRKAGKAGKK